MNNNTVTAATTFAFSYCNQCGGYHQEGFHMQPQQSYFYSTPQLERIAAALEAIAKMMQERK